PKHLLGAAMLALVVLLSGCYGRVRGAGESVANVPVQYDVTLQAAKDGQFILDGAMLTVDDLIGHFRYLADQKQLPKTVLLKDGEDTKIKNTHLETLASLQLNYHFTAYVEHKGKLTLMNSVEDVNEKSDKGDQKQ
ncbi:MAG: hypothetical protein ABIY40_02970, partial [Rhodanobacteraceae bacterium]